VIVAFLTHGEGYHNFHHTFQIDYRNGIRWYHWDPTKWTIWALSLIGLASKLRKISYFEILRARLANDETFLRNKGIAQDKIAALKVKILHSMEQVQQMKQEYKNLKIELEQKKQHMQAEYAFRKDEMKHKTEEIVSRMETKLREIRTNIELTQVEFQMGLRQWRICIAA
jgi:stearoyl-CoA desaturase (delta-9 desaturase)